MATGASRGPKRLHVEVAGERRLVTVEPVGSIGDVGFRLRVSWDDTKYEVDASRLRSGALSLIVPAVGHASHEVTCHETAPGDLLLGIGGRRVRALVTDGRSRGMGAAGPANIGDHPVAAPMPGRVVRVLVESGDVVDVGQGLVVVEAMKMENEIASPIAGVVREVSVASGASVEAGGMLVVVGAQEDDS